MTAQATDQSPLAQITSRWSKSAGHVSETSIARCHLLIEELGDVERERPELLPFLKLFLELPSFAGALVQAIPDHDGMLQLEPTDDYWQLRQGVEENSLEILGDLYQRLVQAYADEEQQIP